MNTSYSPNGHFIDIQGVSTYFNALGSEKGYPIILLHGFLSTSDTWKHVGSLLAKNYRVYMLDLPGSGKSEPLKVASVDSYSDFLAQFFTAIGVEEAILVGTQMGGSISAWFAAKYPKLVKYLVIMAAGAMGEKKTNMWLYKLIASQSIGYIIVKIFPFKLFCSRWRAACVNQKAITDDVILNYFNYFKNTGHIQTKLALNIRASYGSKFEIFEPFMGQIKAPTLLIWGKDDPIVPVSTAYRFHASIKSSQLVLIPNCGDFPHEEYPDKVTDFILKFVS